jgi:uncharacterized protein
MPRKIALRRSPIHGNGVFAVAPLAPETRVAEYRGRRLRQDDADEIYGDTLDTGHTFLFTLNDDYLIDANVGGNIARWINHSCAPNCEALLIVDRNGDAKRDRVIIEARRNIGPGEELTYDYGITLAVPHTARLKALWACRCGAPNCSGTMLKPKPRATPKPKARSKAKTESNARTKSKAKAEARAKRPTRAEAGPTSKSGTTTKKVTVSKPAKRTSAAARRKG